MVFAEVGRSRWAGAATCLTALGPTPLERKWADASPHQLPGTPRSALFASRTAFNQGGAKVPLRFINDQLLFDIECSRPKDPLRKRGREGYQRLSPKGTRAFKSCLLFCVGEFQSAENCPKEIADDAPSRSVQTRESLKAILGKKTGKMLGQAPNRRSE